MVEKKRYLRINIKKSAPLTTLSNNHSKKTKKKLCKKNNAKLKEQEKYERKLWRPYNPWTLP